MNLTCDGIREHLLDHCAGELVVEIRESFEAHLGICENCLHYVESYRHTVKVMRALPRCELPAAVEERLRARLREHLGR
jgi:anti-sigma factor RsiW